MKNLETKQKQKSILSLSQVVYKLTNGDISSKDKDANMAPQAGNASHHIIDNKKEDKDGQSEILKTKTNHQKKIKIESNEKVIDKTKQKHYFDICGYV